MAQKNRIKYLPILLVFLSLNLLAQNTPSSINPIILNNQINTDKIEDAQITFEVKNVTADKITIEAQIPEGYYTYIESDYANKISFSNNNNQIETIYPEGKLNHGDIIIYDTAKFSLILNNKLHSGNKIDISYQLCLEAEMICLAPIYTTIEIDGLNLDIEQYENITMLDNNSILKIDVENQSVVLIAILIFIAGFLSSLLPCSYPLIPITISVVSGRSIASRKEMSVPKAEMKSTLLSSLFFCLGLTFTYTILGAIISLAGYFLGETILFGMMGYNPIFLSIIVVFFMFFSLSMFGLYDFKMPSFLESLKSRRLEKSLKRDKVSVLDKFLIGSLMGVVASPCAAPIVATIIEISLLNPSAAIIYMALYGLGFSVFLFIIGVSSSIITKMPKSGSWMNIVRLVFTIVMFSIVFYYLNTLLKILGVGHYSGSIALLMILLITTLVYIIRKPNIFIEKKLIIIVYAILSISMLAMFIYDCIREKEIKGITLEQAFVLSREQNKNIIIDFTAIWCINCKKLKENVFSNDELKEYINSNYIFVEIDVDKEPDISKAYDVRWLPWVTIVDNNGDVIYVKNRFGSFDEKMADITLLELKQLKNE